MYMYFTEHVFYWTFSDVKRRVTRETKRTETLGEDKPQYEHDRSQLFFQSGESLNLCSLSLFVRFELCFSIGTVDKQEFVDSVSSELCCLMSYIS